MYCPECKSENFKLIDNRKFFCSSCGLTFYKNIATGVGVFIGYNGKYIFAVRKKDPCRGMLDVPGGFVDPCETLEEACVREVMEELHLKIEKPSYLCSFPNLYKYKNMEYNVIDAFFTVDLNYLPDVVPDDDVLDIVWREPQSIDRTTIAFPSMRKALDLLIKS